MTAVHVDLYIEQGVDWPGIGFPIFDADDAPFAGLPGCTARGQIRLSARDIDAQFTWSTDPAEDEGLIVFQDHLVIPSMTAEQSAALDFHTAVYDIKLTNPDGLPGQRVLRVANGTVTLSQEVTRND